LLSYRHSFHAGNFADLLKHIVLVEILDYLIQKESGFEYIDTHAGAGLYSLSSAEAQKLKEYAGGIGKLDAEDFPELARYFEVIGSFNPAKALEFYPGSPMIANFFLRSQDRAWLHELHPRDYDLLRETMSESTITRVQRQDGFEGLNGLLPPTRRRGLILIDPSYEIKSDYDRVVTNLVTGHKKFSQGIFALWYPVIDRRTIDKLQAKLIKSGIRNIQIFELGACADAHARGMTSSGMIVINPPWTLFDKMSQVLPRLAQQIGDGTCGHFKCDVMVPE
jgi:23S rRNA (adenine2030-N6)-methyltransferase